MELVSVELLLLTGYNELVQCLEALDINKRLSRELCAYHWLSLSKTDRSSQTWCLKDKVHFRCINRASLKIDSLSMRVVASRVTFENLEISTSRLHFVESFTVCYPCHQWRLSTQERFSSAIFFRG